MITADNSIFPNNVIAGLVARFDEIDSDLFVTSRPLRTTDPLQSVGVFGTIWSPVLDSMELRGRLGANSNEPTLGRYTITIQAYVKDADEERGAAVHSVLSGTVRAILYRDQPLRDYLGGLTSEVEGLTERAQRWGVTNQRYLTNELESEWLYLSSIEMFVETQIL